MHRCTAYLKFWVLLLKWGVCEERTWQYVFTRDWESQSALELLLWQMNQTSIVPLTAGVSSQWWRLLTAGKSVPHVQFTGLHTFPCIVPLTQHHNAQISHIAPLGWRCTLHPPSTIYRPRRFSVKTRSKQDAGHEVRSVIFSHHAFIHRGYCWTVWQ